MIEKPRLVVVELPVENQRAKCPLCSKTFDVRPGCLRIKHACPEIIQTGSFRSWPKLNRILGIK